MRALISTRQLVLSGMMLLICGFPIVEDLNAQTRCPRAAVICPATTFCSEVMPGKCIPQGKVDCGPYSCNLGEQCGTGNKCVQTNVNRDRGETGLWGAIAIDLETDKIGWSHNFSDPIIANNKALEKCALPGCKVMLGIPPKKCGAIATAVRINGWGAAIRSEEDTAKDAALSNCHKHNPGEECLVRDATCNSE